MMHAASRRSCFFYKIVTYPKLAGCGSNIFGPITCVFRAHLLQVFFANIGGAKQRNRDQDQMQPPVLIYVASNRPIVLPCSDPTTHAFATPQIGPTPRQRGGTNFHFYLRARSATAPKSGDSNPAAGDAPGHTRLQTCVPLVTI